MKKNLSVLVAVLIVMFILIAGCAAPSQTESAQEPASDNAEVSEEEPASDNAAAEEEPNKVLKIQYVMQSMENEFCLQQLEGVKMKAAELGIELDIQAPKSAADGSADQLSFMETALASGVDGIIVMPSSGEALVPAVKKCQDLGIPLVTLDQAFIPEVIEENGLDPVPYIGTNNVTGGKLIGEFVMANFPEGTKTVIIKGIEGSSCNTDRLEGFFGATGEGDDCYVDVLSSQNANWGVEEGYTVMQNMISANPDIELVFALCDNMGIGALRAIEEAGKEDQIKIVSYDGNPEALNLVEQGKFMADGGQHPGMMGELGVQYVYDWITKGEVPPENTDTGITVVTMDNIAEFRESNAKYTSDLE